ncbi:hypothetical protein BaRGS_00001876 [Batillaria attramentaria]|uniref:G-protein coupled receptors family 1 profile domain-containing protein n=1 Tax=Batillaria attramentaria TaxID=370345 RepID=A0ABD0M5L5_9CAEN
MAQKINHLYVISEFVVGFLSVASNSLVLVAMYKVKSLRTHTNCFIASLAVADILAGLVVGPLAVTGYLGHPRNFYGCLLMNTLVVIFTMCSVTSLTAVTLDRYLAICHPFTYIRKMTFRVTISVVVVSWVVGILFGLVPLMGWNKGKENFKGACEFQVVICLEYMVYFVFFAGNLIPFLFMVCVYTHIFFIIRKAKAADSRRTSTTACAGHVKPHHLWRETRKTLSLVLVVIVFEACWLPVYIHLSTILLAPEYSPSHEFLLFAIVLCHANSFANPIVYAFSLKAFRQAFVQILTGNNAQVIPGPSTHGTSLSTAVYHPPRRGASSAPMISLASSTPGPQ